MRRSDGKFRRDSKIGKHFEKIVRLYKEGWSTQRLGKRFGIDPSNIYRDLKSRGVPTRTRTEAARNAIKLGVHIFPAGPACHNWRGGRRVHTEGYILIKNPDHPRADSQGYVPEHVLVAENILGRPLERNEVAHHINRKKDDNRPENLQVMNVTDHRTLHGHEGAAIRWSGK